MRVLTITSLFPNRVQPDLGIFIYQRLAHFARRPGNDVQVIAPVPYAPKWAPGKRWRPFSRVPKEEKVGGLQVYHPRYPLLPHLMPLHGFLMFAGTRDIARRLHRARAFDCIDAHYVYPDGFAAVLAGKELDLPVIVSARGTDINVFPSFPTVRPLIRWTLRQVAGAIAVCTPLKNEMLRLGVVPDRTRVIGNGVDLKRFHPVDPLEARRRLHLPETDKIIVAVGSLKPVKGYQCLIPAVAALQQPFPDLRLYIIGEGVYRGKLEARVQRTGLRDRVVLVGGRPNEELKLWFSAADLSCLCSSHEGWPNVLLESMACGTPVLATNVSGVPEIITSPELGILVEQDTESIARGIQHALSQRWDRTAIACYAARRTWDVVAAEMEEYLTRIVKPAMATSV